MRAMAFFLPRTLSMSQTAFVNKEHFVPVQVFTPKLNSSCKPIKFLEDGDSVGVILNSYFRSAPVGNKPGQRGGGREGPFCRPQRWS